MTISNSNFNTYFSVLVPSNESNLDQLIIKGSQFQTINNIISVDSDVGSILLADNLFIVGSANEYALTIVYGHAITAISVTGASSYNQNANTIVANHFDGFATPINLGSGSKGWNVQSNAYANNSGPNLNSGVGNMLGGGSQ
jgi:nitrous oxidase accessory protein NosD